MHKKQHDHNTTSRGKQNKATNAQIVRWSPALV